MAQLTSLFLYKENEFKLFTIRLFCYFLLFLRMNKDNYLLTNGNKKKIEEKRGHLIYLFLLNKIEYCRISNNLFDFIITII